MNIEDVNTDISLYQENFESADKWIISKFQKAVKETTDNIDKFRINDALNSVYHFFWHDYCDWYLEMIKSRLYHPEKEKDKETALTVATYIMKGSMELLHPFLPFITEEIWQNFKSGDEKSIVISSWPEAQSSFINEKAEAEIELIREAVSGIRNIRAEMNVPPGKKIRLQVNADDAMWSIIENNKEHFHALAKIESVIPLAKDFNKSDAGTVVVRNVEFFIALDDLIDKEKEKERLEKEIGRLQGLEKAILGKLNNENFVSRAPEKVVENERNKLINIQENLNKVRLNYEKFK
jgi:valyl-tRNA synthetase